MVFISSRVHLVIAAHVNCINLFIADVPYTRHITTLCLSLTLACGYFMDYSVEDVSFNEAVFIVCVEKPQEMCMSWTPTYIFIMVHIHGTYKPGSILPQTCNKHCS